MKKLVILCSLLGVMLAILNIKMDSFAAETVTIGNYWQVDTNGDGVADENDDKTPINWRILKIYPNGTAFVMSEKILDLGILDEADIDRKVSYDEGVISVSETIKSEYHWETSQMRKWLNNTFYNNTFSADEKKAIVKSYVRNEDNPTWAGYGGNDTYDNIFLISELEAENPDYGFQKKEGLNELYSGLIAYPTDYAKHREASMSSYDWPDTHCFWTRSPGAGNHLGVVITNDRDGYSDVLRNGIHYWEYNNGIRPVMVVNLLSPYVNYANKASVKVTGKDGYGSKIRKGTIIKRSTGTYEVLEKSNWVKPTVRLVTPVNKKIKSITVPDYIVYEGVILKVSDIKANAFKNCRNLKSVELGYSLDSVGKNAFYGCKRLKSITIKRYVAPNIGKNAFKGVNKRLVIKVPKEVIKEYKVKLKRKTGFNKKTMKLKKYIQK